MTDEYGMTKLDARFFKKNMSKSLTWCKQRAENFSGYIDRKWGNAEELSAEELFDRLGANGLRHFDCGYTADDGSSVRYSVDIEFDQNADFEYFTSASSVHDGTVAFVAELLNDRIIAVCCGSTFRKDVGGPRGGDKIHYVVGNFVMLTEHDGDWVPTDKKWMRTRTTILLPLKMYKE